MTKCTGCGNCKTAEFDWPYCTLIEDYVTLNEDGSCDYCPDNSSDENR